MSDRWMPIALGYVTPFAALHDRVDRTMVDAESFRQAAPCPAVCRELAQFHYIIHRELASGPRFSAIHALRVDSAPYAVSPLRDHIAHVVGMCTEEEVVRANTRGRVAGVENMQPPWILSYPT